MFLIYINIPADSGTIVNVIYFYFLNDMVMSVTLHFKTAKHAFPLIIHSIFFYIFIYNNNFLLIIHFNIYALLYISRYNKK